MCAVEEKNILIGVSLRKAQKNNERAMLHKIWCQKTDICPLFKRGLCLRSEILPRCVYGKNTSTQSGSTKRGKAYDVFISEAKAKLKSGEYPKPPKGYYRSCIIEIGDYYYLNYPQMNNHHGENKIPFLEHSNFWIHGSKFIKKENFTPEIICEIVKFKPQAIMGGEITSYQKEEIPKFLFHLKYSFPQLFAEAVKLMPEIKDRVLDLNTIEQISATMADIEKNCVRGYSLGKDIEPLKWDGTTLICKGSSSAFYIIFCNIKTIGEITMSFEPDKEKTKVSITDSKLKKYVCQKNPELIK